MIWKLGVASAAALALVSGFIGHQLDRHPRVQHVLVDAANDVEATRYFRALGISCGVEAWSVKTMADSQAVNLTPLATNIPALINLSGTPGSRPSTQAMSLHGTRLVEYKLEADSDIHLVLQSTLGSHPTMIAEIPNPGCASSSRVLGQISAARAAFVTEVGQPQTFFTHVSDPVNVTGIPFTDFAHGQTGADPNQTELHPVIAFRRVK